ncbi:sensor domain-containing protein [Mycobacterium sp. 852013-50091_SCH5140682]|uniref:sensor domain-containing protein n=1 Tax=Mycobacterium sp. 852013-50091_SCH5140682 TaxID=1834109 RepID=UPI0009EE9D03|nr:sensor domain-containing protein [Mycobacterium sp. 852013-50091_SCH5140682]
MTLGGGHSPNPFDVHPFGAGPPPPPPPPERRGNTLATLSVIFAVVFAPVGALLGHLALSEIRRRPQQGRDRAVVGVTLSYCAIAIMVVAVVVWSLLPSGTDTSLHTTPYAMQSRASTTVSTQVPHSSSTTPTTLPTPLPGTWLLDGPELTGVLHVPFYPNVQSQTQGPLSKMLDRASIVDAPECLAANTIAALNIYAPSGGTEFAQQAWAPPVSATGWLVEEAVIVYPSEELAKAQLAAMTQQWKDCVGRTMTFPSNGENYTLKDMQATDSTLEGLVAGPSPSTPNRHTVSVRDRYIVDVRVVRYASNNDDPGSGASDVADAIFMKIGV